MVIFLAFDKKSNLLLGSFDERKVCKFLLKIDILIIGSR
jgi:hypothetical protein